MRAHIAWWSVLALALLVQTTLLASILPDAWRPDPTRAMVVWLALTGVPRGGVFAAFGAGLALDVFSGSPAGLLSLARLVLYALARPARGVIEMGWTVVLLGPAAVAADTLVFAGMREIAFANSLPLSSILGVAARQAAGELVLFPLMFILLEVATGFHGETEVRA